MLAMPKPLVVGANCARDADSLTFMRVTATFKDRRQSLIY